MEGNASPFENIVCKKILRNINRITCHLADQAGYEREVFCYEINLFYSDSGDFLEVTEDILKRLSAINHPVIPSVIDIKKEEKRIVIVFRKPDGDIISERVKKGSFFSNKQLWELAYTLASGFSLLNAAGIYPGGFREYHIIYEGDRWWRFHPDIFAEMLNRKMESTEGNAAQNDISARHTDITCLGRFICSLATADLHFKVLSECESMTEAYSINAIDILGKNSDITPEQEKFIKRMILATTPNGNGFDDFNQIIEQMPQVIQGE